MTPFGRSAYKSKNSQLRRNISSDCLRRNETSKISLLLFIVAVGSLPAVLGNIENDAVRILELAFKVAVTFVAKIEEEFSAMRLDALLGLGQIVDLEAEMVRADEAAGVFEVGGFAASVPLEVQ